MNNKIYFIFITLYLQFPLLALAQKPWADEPDSLWRWDWRADTAEILSVSDQEKMGQFVQQECVRFMAAMYAQKYNIDSLFPDKLSRELFFRNPFIAEFPEGKAYEFHPEFLISNVILNQCYGRNCYLKDVYEVIKLNYFIRPADPVLGIQADTLWHLAQINNRPVTAETQVTDDDRCFAVYYEIGKPMRMVGGSAFLAGFPEPVPFHNRDAQESMAETLVRVRMIGRISPNPRPNGLHQYPVGYIDRLDTIGSFTNGLRFFVPDTYWSGDSLPSKSGRFDLIPHPLATFYLTEGTYERSSNNPEPKLIVVPFPIYMDYRYSIPHSPYPAKHIILKESLAAMDIFTIFFTTDLENWHKEARFGYVPGFYAYEVKRVFKSRPEGPEDNFRRVRGMSKEEFERMKSKPYLKLVCHEGKL